MKFRVIVLAAALLLTFPASSALAGWSCDGGGADPCCDSSGLPNFDGDDIRDECDNCRLVFNPSQTDIDGDGCGNSCDPDFDQNGIVAIGDFSILAPLLNSPSPPAPLQVDIAPDPPDGVIAIGDFSLLASMLNGPPGPSGTTSGTTACP